MDLTDRLFECKKKKKKKQNVRNGLPHLNTLSKENKLRIILNLSCENHVINDVMNTLKQFVLFMACYKTDGHSQ